MVNYQSHQGICYKISKFGIYLAHFTIFYLILLTFSFSLIFMRLWRIFVIFYIHLFYNGKYTLLSASDALVCPNILPNTMNLNFVIFVSDICDLKELRTRILTNISASDKDGNIRYKKFFYTIVTKFGFYCFEDKRNSFDINHHVRHCPSVEKSQRIYTESELFSMIETSAFQEWDSSRPCWEMMLIPKIKKDETDQICSAITIRISHGSVDGISIANFILNCVFDQPSPKLIFNPVNPSIPRISLYQKILLYIKVFFIGPHILLKNSGCSDEQIMHENRMAPSYKFMRRSKFQLSLETMKQIRKTFDCSTQAVFHSAFNGALKKFAKGREFPIPPEVLGALSVVRFPYPNEYPQNRAFLSADLLPIGIEDPVVRLRKINAKLKSMASPEVVLTNALFVYLIGLLPATLFYKIFCSAFKLAYYISNVPGGVGSATIFGKDVPLICGVGPLVKGIHAAVGLTCCNGMFSAQFVVKKSELFKTGEDLGELIEEFETELKHYVTASSL